MNCGNISEMKISVTIADVININPKKTSGFEPPPCIRLARGKFELTNQDSEQAGKHLSSVRKPISANTGLKVNPGNNFSCLKVLSIAYILCS